MLSINYYIAYVLFDTLPWKSVDFVAYSCMVYALKVALLHKNKPNRMFLSKYVMFINFIIHLRSGKTHIGR